MGQLKTSTKIAQDAVADLEEPYKSIAFRVFLDKLLTEKCTVSIPQIKTAVPLTAITENGNIDSEHLDLICSKINRTEYPEINKLKKAKDRALFVLKLVRDTGGRDGMSAKEISTVLDKVFRLNVTKQSINMVLFRETKLVDCKSIHSQGGDTNFYRIMSPGEEYLNSVLNGGNSQ